MDIKESETGREFIIERKLGDFLIGILLNLFFSKSTIYDSFKRIKKDEEDITALLDLTSRIVAERIPEKGFLQEKSFLLCEFLAFWVIFSQKVFCQFTESNSIDTCIKIAVHKIWNEKRSRRGFIIYKDIDLAQFPILKKEGIRKKNLENESFEKELKNPFVDIQKRRYEDSRAIEDNYDHLMLVFLSVAKFEIKEMSF